jgi:hypothetical protein
LKVLHLTTQVELDAIHAAEFTVVNNILLLLAFARLDSSATIGNLRVDKIIELNQNAALTLKLLQSVFLVDC